MGRACFDEYFSEIEIDDLGSTELEASETCETDESSQKSSYEVQRRKAIENYQERKRLRNDLEYFS